MEKRDNKTLLQIENFIDRQVLYRTIIYINTRKKYIGINIHTIFIGKKYKKKVLKIAKTYKNTRNKNLIVGVQAKLNIYYKISR